MNVSAEKTYKKIEHMKKDSQNHSQYYAYRRYGKHSENRIKCAGDSSAGKRYSEYAGIGKNVRKQIYQSVKSAETAEKLA